MEPELKRLQLVVKKAWVADNLHSLGVGHIYHLAYGTADMHPEVQEDLARETLAPGSPAEVALASANGEAVPVADVELCEVHRFASYVRFDFRIQRLHPYQRPQPQPGYLCRYVPR